MSATIKFDLDQVKSLVLQFNTDEKIELAKYLDKLTLKNRLENIFKSLKVIHLSFDEISAEVDAVREEHSKYRSKNNK